MQANKKVVVGQYAVWSEIDHLHQRAKWQNGKVGKMANGKLWAILKSIHLPPMHWKKHFGVLWWAEMNIFFAMFKATQHPSGLMVIKIPAFFGMPSQTASFEGGPLLICYKYHKNVLTDTSSDSHYQERKQEMFQGFEGHNN